MILLVTNDLMILSRVSIAAEAAQIELRSADSYDQAVRQLELCRPQLLLVDLQMRDLDLKRLIHASRDLGIAPRTVAFAQHVQVDLLQSARRDCEAHVMSRGEFCRQLPKIIAEQQSD
jgi:DNA-binding NtrC family response regulator